MSLVIFFKENFTTQSNKMDYEYIKTKPYVPKFNQLQQAGMSYRRL